MESIGNKILIIGNGDSVFVKDFIYRYSVRGVSVDLLSLAECELLPIVNSQFNCVMQKENFWGKFGRFVNLTIQIAKALKKLNHTYDCIIIHYVNFILFPHVLNFKKKTKNLVSIVYGSDYYRSNRFKDKLQLLIYAMSNKIVFTNPKTRDDFHGKFNKIKPNKLCIARFGLPVLDEIDKIKLNDIPKEEIKRFFNFPDNKIIILVGYSASKAHRQTLVINAISEMKLNLKDKIHLVFPLGYGDAKIENSIREELDKTDITDFSILNNFYNSIDSARLRCVTDILINIQQSDQFSGSMQETLYAGGNIVAGEWLPYEELIDLGCNITTVKEPKYVGNAIEKLIEACRAHSSEPTYGVKEFIQSTSSWRTNIKIWDEILYSGYCNDMDVK